MFDITFIPMFSCYFHILFLPDGFHTSASDPALQKKYGHTKNIIDTAPPPIFNMVISNGYGNGNGGGLPPQNGMYAPQVYIQQEITPSGHPKYSSAGHNHQ